MATRRWDGTGPHFRIPWAGRTWTLRLDAPHPGLYADGCGPLLGLGGIAAAGRSDASALSGATMAEFACRFDRVEATYQPPGWGDMTVRAIWSPAPDDEAMDLLVELTAHSVGDLKAVEVLTISALEPPADGPRPAGGRRRVLPRDERCAALARDGREGDPGSLTVEPPASGDAIGAWTGRGSALGDIACIVLAHPDDVSRRIVDEAARSVRHALFGYDLERGVVLRGRLRALWCRDEDPAPVAAEALARFQREPLPLST